MKSEIFIKKQVSFDTMFFYALNKQAKHKNNYKHHKGGRCNSRQNHHDFDDCQKQSACRLRNSVEHDRRQDENREADEPHYQRQADNVSDQSGINFKFFHNYGIL